MLCKTVLLFLAVSITSINAARLGAFAPRDLSSNRLAVFVPQDLNARAVNTAGGWSLSQTTTGTCPATAPICGSTWCCPGALECIHTGSEDTAEVCCPTNADCSATFLATPACADASWSLWNATGDTSDNGGFFCCLQGQVGLQTGSCVEEADAVTAGAPAVQLATGTGSVQSEVPATTVSGSSSPVATTATTTASTTGGVTSATSTVVSSSSSSSSSSSPETTSSSSAIVPSPTSARSSTPPSSALPTMTGKSDAAGLYYTGMTSLGGAVAAVLAFALL